MSIKRSEFLRLSAWGIVATLIPLHQVKALSFISELNSTNQDDHIIARAKAKLAKAHFFKKEYVDAENLYLECIALASADIRFYDNLENVYAAQGKWLLIVELFKNGLIANPNKISFYDRAARSLMRLELGYEHLALEYRNQINSSSLLNDAKQLYNQAIQINPDAKFLKIGKKKVKNKIQTNALTINYWSDNQVREDKKTRRNKHKRRYKKFTNQELLQKVTQIDAKTRNTLYFPSQVEARNKHIIKEKKIIHTLLAKRYKKDNLFTESIEQLEIVYNLDNKDYNAIKILKRLYKKGDHYNKLLSLQRNHNLNEQTLYSHLGLMNALLLKYKNTDNQLALLNESIEIGEDLYNNWGLLENQKIRVLDKLVDTYVLSNSYALAREYIEQAIEKSSSVIPESLINTLTHCYAKTYFKNHQYDESVTILKMGLKEVDLERSNSFPYIKNIVVKKEENKFSTNLRLYYLLFRTYKKQNDSTNMALVIQKLTQNNPEDKFVLRHS